MKASTKYRLYSAACWVPAFAAFLYAVISVPFMLYFAGLVVLCLFLPMFGIIFSEESKKKRCEENGIPYKEEEEHGW